MSHGCQHAAERKGPAPRPGQQRPGPLFCGAEASLWQLPDMTTGNYCDAHGPQVRDLVQRRLNRKA